jgi:ADP-ribosylation factor-like protein 3
LILGLDNAGKSSIIRSIANENINDVAPTLGFNIKHLSTRNVALTIMDMSG